MFIKIYLYLTPYTSSLFWITSGLDGYLISQADIFLSSRTDNTRLLTICYISVIPFVIVLIHVIIYYELYLVKLLCSCNVFHKMVFMCPKELPHGALSQQFPCLNIDCFMPFSFRILIKVMPVQ